jgi:hypothetical protein
MATMPEAMAKIDVGRVLGKGFGALRDNFPAFFGVSILLGGVPAFLTYYMAFAGASTLDLNYMISPSFWGPIGGSGFVMLLASAMLQGVLARSTILHLSGRDAEVGESLALGFRLILPIIGVTICAGVLVAFGLIALIVPGIMVYCATIVAVPALVEERSGVFASISRSWELTRGTRGRIFLLVIVLGIISSGISQVADRISGMNFDPATQAFPNPLLVGTVEGIVGSVTAAIGAVVLAALYVELREVKEGASPNDLANIFA